MTDAKLNRELNDSVRRELHRILAARFDTWAEAARHLRVTQTWLGRRIPRYAIEPSRPTSTKRTKLTLDDVELICSRLDIPLSDVLKPGEAAS